MAREIEPLARRLRELRQTLAREVDAAETEIASLADNRDPEFEETAQGDWSSRVLSRFDVRVKREIEEIDAALGRIAAGSYGRCERCGREIPVQRLQAMPATRYCLDDARAAESEREAPAAGSETVRGGADPADMALMTDREKEIALCESVREDGRVDADELRIVCRKSVVYLEGAVPSDPERQILLKLVTEVGGFTDVVDHLQVNPVLWENEQRSKEERAESAPPWDPPDPNETEDIVQSIEEGLEWNPPGEPLPDEE